MKTMKCDLCEVTADGETFEGWMEALKPHYMQTHADVMSKHGEGSPEEAQKAMGAWMADNKARFDQA